MPKTEWQEPVRDGECTCFTLESGGPSNALDQGMIY